MNSMFVIKIQSHILLGESYEAIKRIKRLVDVRSVVVKTSATIILKLSLSQGTIVSHKSGCYHITESLHKPQA